MVPVQEKKKFSNSSFAAEKKDGQIIQFLQQKRGSQIICFWVYFLQKGFLIQIRFRGQFLGEIFINLS